MSLFLVFLKPLRSVAQSCGSMCLSVMKEQENRQIEMAVLSHTDLQHCPSLHGQDLESMISLDCF